MKKIKKIAVFVGQFPKFSNTFIYDEIKTLEESGFDIFIFSLQNPSHEKDFELLKGIRSQVTYLQKNTTLFRIILGHLYALFFHTKEYFTLFGEVARRKLSIKVFTKYIWVAKNITDINPDFIHAHLIEPQTIIARICSRLSKIPYTFKIHGSDAFAGCPNSLDFLCRDAKKCFVVSSATCNHLIEKYKIDYNNYVIHPCGINLSRFKPKRKPRQRHLLCVSRLIKTKGISYLIEAAKILREEDFEFELNIVGDGYNVNDFKNLVKELDLTKTVFFSGALIDDQLIDAYQQSDLFILPSLCEGLGMVLIEAMACGIPCIATRVGGIPEVIVDEFNGLLVRPEDPKDLAEKIKYLLTNPLIMEKFSETGQETAKKYDLHAQTKKLIDIWESTVT